MKRRRILQFPIRNTSGGVTQYALNNWRYIDKTRFLFDFATMDSKIDFEMELAQKGCNIHYISCYAEDNINQFTKEFSTILDLGYDAIHLHTSYWKSFTVEKISMNKSIPIIVVHSHNTELGGAANNVNRDDAIAWHNKQKTQFSTELATHFCACSRQAADWLFGPQIPREKIQILKNAVDINRFTYNPLVREFYRDELGLKDSYIIGHIGRFEYQKNHEFLIDVFSEVCKEIPNTKLMLIGIGTLLEDMIAKVNQLGISDKVIFLGKRFDVAELYQAMDLFIFPSRFEGLGIVLIEAQVSGLKCLASDVIPDEVKVTSNIIFLPPDKKLWCNEIVKANKSTYKRFGQSSIIASAGYSIEDQIKILERIYSGE